MRALSLTSSRRFEKAATSLRKKRITFDHIEDQERPVLPNQRASGPNTYQRTGCPSSFDDTQTITYTRDAKWTPKIRFGGTSAHFSNVRIRHKLLPAARGPSANLDHTNASNVKTSNDLGALLFQRAGCQLTFSARSSVASLKRRTITNAATRVLTLRVTIGASTASLEMQSSTASI